MESHSVEHFYDILCWNVMGKTDAGLPNSRKTLMDKYFKQLQTKADIIFLQELPWKPTKLTGSGGHVPSLSSDYDYSSYSQEKPNSRYNCVIFSTKKFEKIKDLQADVLKEITSLKPEYMQDIISQPSQVSTRETDPTQRRENLWSEMVEDMGKRVCVVILREKEGNHEFIAASLHRFSRNVGNCTPFELAKLFCKTLAKLGDSRKLPIF